MKGFRALCPLLAEGLKNTLHHKNGILYHHSYFTEFPKKNFEVKKF